MCEIPYQFETCGYINYIGNDIDLDVSRNHIISGFKDLQKEMTLILLKHIKGSEENEELTSIIDEMIKFYGS